MAFFCIFLSNAPVTPAFYDLFGKPIVVPGPPLIISIEKDKVSLQIPGDSLRMLTLQEIGKLYDINFSADEYAHFINTGVVSIPLAGFQNNIFDRHLDQANSNDPGVPYQLEKSELYNWVKQARIADKNLYNLALLITLKVDKASRNSTIQQVEDVLDQQYIIKFRLITPQKDTLIDVRIKCESEVD